MSSSSPSTIMSSISPIRKKRNFKALQLKPPPITITAPQPPTEPVAVRAAPTVAPPTSAARKRPPPMVIKAPKIANSGVVSAIEQDTKDNVLVVSNGPGSAPNTASAASIRRNTYHATLSNTLANLDMNAENKFDLRNEDLKDLQELGQGNGGSVKKVEHVPTGTIMAKKVRTSI